MRVSWTIFEGTGLNSITFFFTIMTGGIPGHFFEEFEKIGIA